MLKWFQKLIRIFRVKEYDFYGGTIRVFKHKRRAVVYHNDQVIFNNLKTGINFRRWWKQFKKDKQLVKLKRKEKEKRFIGYMVSREAENPVTAKWDRQIKSKNGTADNK